MNDSMPDYADALTAVENALRLLIETVGIAKCGISAADERKWRARRDRDLAQRGAGFPEDRLLHYSDISDLQRIVAKDVNWPLFEAALLDRTEVSVLLELIRRLRNPDAHNRELSTHERALVIGISGELRTRITRYLSRMDTPDAYFPRIIAFQNSIGARPGEQPNLHVGDEVEFVVDAADPLGASLEYRFGVEHPGLVERSDWSSNNRWTWCVSTAHISRFATVIVHVRSPREYHAQGEFDAAQQQMFTVLPR